jgi:hypothetical protein
MNINVVFHSVHKQANPCSNVLEKYNQDNASIDEPINYVNDTELLSILNKIYTFYCICNLFVENDKLELLMKESRQFLLYFYPCNKKITWFFAARLSAANTEVTRVSFRS